MWYKRVLKEETNIMLKQIVSNRALIGPLMAILLLYAAPASAVTKLDGLVQLSRGRSGIRFRSAHWRGGILHGGIR